MKNSLTHIYPFVETNLRLIPYENKDDILNRSNIQEIIDEKV